MEDEVVTGITVGMLYLAGTFLAGLGRSACNTINNQEDKQTRSYWGIARDFLSAYGLGRYASERLYRGAKCFFGSNGTAAAAPSLVNDDTGGQVLYYGVD